MNKSPIEVGTLVFDANPYRAPEANMGIGIVIEVIDVVGVVNHMYVKVCWIKSNIITNVSIRDLEVYDESW